MKSLVMSLRKWASGSAGRLDSFTLTGILTIFFLAGFGSLAYQVVWVKSLGRTFGVTNYAVTTVLTAFMAGLALGGYLGGRLADRRTDGMRVFGYLEICLGFYTLTMPALFDLLTAVYRVLYPALANSSFWLTLTRFSLSFGLLVLPTTLIGASFPILVRSLMGRQGQLGSKLARLYSWNNLGSVIGSIGTGCILIGVWGVNATLLLASVLNLLIGVTALLLSAMLPPAEQVIAGAPPAPSPVKTPPASRISRAVLVVTFLSGFAALGYEIVWIRILNLLSDHSIYIFSTIVAVVLIGIALGSQWAAQAAARGVNPLRALIVIQAALGLSAALWLPAILGLVKGVRSLLGGEITGNPFIGLALLVTLVPSLFMGVSFPLTAQVYARAAERTGQQVGEVYSTNVLGAMLGSIVTGFVFIPFIGAQRSLWLLGLVNFSAAVWAARAGDRRGWVAVSSGAMAVLAAALLLAPNTLYVTLFMSLYPPVRVTQVFESVEGTVTVSEHQGNSYIYTNGVHDADTTPFGLGIHRLIGYLPGFVRGAPKRALVVGLGGGTTSGTLTQYVQDEVQIVELSEGMVSAARLISMYNDQVLTNPRATLVIADGRNYLSFTDQKYDIIAADTIYPMQAYSSNLYSSDYYRLLLTHLEDQGVVVQWIDTGLQDNEQRILMRTFAQTFPYVSLWQSQGVKLMLGAKEPIVPQREEITRRFTASMTAQLAPMGITGPGDILSGFRLSDAALRADLGPGLIISDDQPYNEYFQLLRTGGLGEWLDR